MAPIPLNFCLSSCISLSAFEQIGSLDSRIIIRGLGFILGIGFYIIDSSLALKFVHKAFDYGLICEVAGRKAGLPIEYHE